MSSTQPQPHPRSTGPAPRAVRKAKAEPSIDTVVDALSAMHEDNAGRWRGQWETNRRLEDGIDRLENGMESLLAHFNLPSLPPKNT